MAAPAAAYGAGWTPVRPWESNDTLRRLREDGTYDWLRRDGLFDIAGARGRYPPRETKEAFALAAAASAVVPANPVGVLQFNRAFIVQPGLSAGTGVFVPQRAAAQAAAPLRYRHRASASVPAAVPAVPVPAVQARASGWMAQNPAGTGGSVLLPAGVNEAVLAAGMDFAWQALLHEPGPPIERGGGGGGGGAAATWVDRWMPLETEARVLYNRVAAGMLLEIPALRRAALARLGERLSTLPLRQLELPDDNTAPTRSTEAAVFKRLERHRGDVFAYADWAATCAGCGKVAAWRCAGCHQERYCSRACQVDAWSAHAAQCPPARAYLSIAQLPAGALAAALVAAPRLTPLRLLGLASASSAQLRRAALSPGVWWHLFTAALAETEAQVDPPTSMAEIRANRALLRPMGIAQYVAALAQLHRALWRSLKIKTDEDRALRAGSDLGALDAVEAHVERILLRDSIPAVGSPEFNRLPAANLADVRALAPPDRRLVGLGPGDQHTGFLLGMVTDDAFIDQRTDLWRSVARARITPPENLDIFFDMRADHWKAQREMLAGVRLLEPRRVRAALLMIPTARANNVLSAALSEAVEAPHTRTAGSKATLEIIALLRSTEPWNAAPARADARHSRALWLAVQANKPAVVQALLEGADKGRPADVGGRALQAALEVYRTTGKEPGTVLVQLLLRADPNSFLALGKGTPAWNLLQDIVMPRGLPLSSDLGVLSWLERPEQARRRLE